MFRYFLLFTLALLPGCAEQPEPRIDVDGEVIDRAVQHAQAQVDETPGREPAK